MGSNDGSRTTHRDHLRLEEPCIEWQGATREGYGAVAVGRRGKGAKKKVRGAHQIAWELEHGRPVPPRHDVCHACDNRLCVNPRHLFLGTRSENMKDARDKGRLRVPRGLRIDMHKAREMRRMRSEGRTRREIAEHFGVSVDLVKGVVAGRTWREQT